MNRKIILIAAAILTLGMTLLYLVECGVREDIAPTIDTTAAIATTAPTDNATTASTTEPQASTQQTKPSDQKETVPATDPTGETKPSNPTKPTQKPTDPVTPTKPFDPAPTVPETTAPEVTEPAPTESTVPEATVPEVTEPVTTPDQAVTYEDYVEMSGDEQRAFRATFESTKAFFEWYNAARAEHDAQNPGIDIGSGSVDMGDLVGGS